MLSPFHTAKIKLLTPSPPPFYLSILSLLSQIQLASHLTIFFFLEPYYIYIYDSLLTTINSQFSSLEGIRRVSILTEHLLQELSHLLVPTRQLLTRV